METPQRSAPANSSSIAGDSSFFFDANTLVNAFDDGTGLTPNQNNRTSCAVAMKTTHHDFWSTGANLAGDMTPTANTTQSKQIGMAGGYFSNGAGQEDEGSADAMLSPDPFGGAPSVAGLSSAGRGTTISRSVARSVYTDDGANSVGRFSMQAVSLGYGFAPDVVEHADDNEGGAYGGAGVYGGEADATPDPMAPTAECQLLLDNSSDGSSDTMECLVDIDALVKVTPSDSKKHEAVFRGHALTNNGRLNMDEHQHCDPHHPLTTSSRRGAGGLSNVVVNTVSAKSNAPNSNNNKMSRAVPLASFMAVDANGKVGDSPAKLTASELRRLARQQQQQQPLLQSAASASVPAAIVADTVNGRRLPAGTAVTTARVLAPRQPSTGPSASHTAAMPSPHTQLPSSVATVAPSQSSATGQAFLPGNAVEVLQPTSRRVAPSAAAKSLHPRPASSCSNSNASASAAQSPSMGASSQPRNSLGNSVNNTQPTAAVTHHHRSGSAREGCSTRTASAHNDSGDSNSLAMSGNSHSGALATATTNVAAGNGYVTAVLEFKMNRRVRYRCPADIAAKVKASTENGGEVYLIVQSDFGNATDAGVCSAFYGAAEKHTIPRSLGMLDQGTVLRIASDEDCDRINNALPDMEERAMQECFQLIHFLHLPFEVVDVEATFDESAVTIFYAVSGNSRSASSSASNSVGRLQRELAHKLRLKVTLEQCTASGVLVESSALTAAAASSTTSSLSENQQSAYHGHQHYGASSAAVRNPNERAASNSSYKGGNINAPAPAAATGAAAVIVQTSARRLPPTLAAMGVSVTAGLGTNLGGASTLGQQPAVSSLANHHSAFSRVPASSNNAPSVSSAGSPPALQSNTATRAPSTMSFAVSTSTPSSIAPQASGTPSSFHVAAAPANNGSRPTSAAIFSADPPTTVTSFVVTGGATNMRASPNGLRGHAATNMAGSNAHAAPWVPPATIGSTPTVRSSCSSPMPECATPINPQSAAAYAPVASSRRTVPSTFITNVQATGDNITYNGTYALGSSSSSSPTMAMAHGGASRPASSVTGGFHHPAGSSSSLGLQSHHLAGMGCANSAATCSHNAVLSRSNNHTPCHGSAHSRTPSVVSLVSPSEASADDYPVASSRRRVYRQ